MSPTEYAIPGGVVDVEHLGARCEARSFLVEQKCAALAKASRRIRRALMERDRRVKERSHAR